MHPKFADFATNHKKAGTLRKTTKFDMLIDLFMQNRMVVLLCS